MTDTLRAWYAAFWSQLIFPLAAGALLSYPF